MEKIIGFDELKVGQRVRVKGKLEGDGTFRALEITMQPPEEEATMTSVIQNVNYDQPSISLLGRELPVPANMIIKDLDHNQVGLKELKAKTLVTVKGKYAPERGFMPFQIRMKETLGVNVDKMKGVIEAIDHEKKTLRVLGFTVTASPKTIVEVL
jgi:hypothetical protein